MNDWELMTQQLEAEWQELKETGLCYQHEHPEWWFPDTYGYDWKGAVRDSRKAQEICQQCPVVGQCLTWAVRTRQPTGIWGGRIFRLLRKEDEE